MFRRSVACQSKATPVPHSWRRPALGPATAVAAVAAPMMSKISLSLLVIRLDSSSFSYWTLAERVMAILSVRRMRLLMSAPVRVARVRCSTPDLTRYALGTGGGSFGSSAGTKPSATSSRQPIPSLMCLPINSLGILLWTKQFAHLSYS